MNIFRWNQTFEIAKTLTAIDRDAARLANLVIVASSAVLMRHGAKTRLYPELLQERIHELSPRFTNHLSKSKRKWADLAGVSVDIAQMVFSPEEIDLWVEAWQDADSGRKTKGAYATPYVFADQLARLALEPYRHVRDLPKIVDPSAGAGALLLACARYLKSRHPKTAAAKIVSHLYGLELDENSRELCCLMLWLMFGADPSLLGPIFARVRVGDAVTHEWWGAGDPNFDVVIMNPPWESLRHSIDETFPHADDRAAAESRLSLRRDGSKGLPALYSSQGIGDRNLFKAFMELAPHLVRGGGQISALVPAAFASDLGMAELRDLYLSHTKISSWTGFENRKRYFQIDSRYKFGILSASRDKSGTKDFRVRSFAVEPDEIEAAHYLVTQRDLKRLGGRARMIPELLDRMEKEILATALSSGSPFFDHGPLGRVAYRRELDLTMGLAKGHFSRFESRKRLTPRTDGTFIDPEGHVFVPVLEGRMVGRYDLLQKSWLHGDGRTAKWRVNGDLPLSNCTPQYIARPRLHSDTHRIAICDVTSSTNTRTVHATWVPSEWRCGNTAPVLEFESPVLALAGLAILNSLLFDWITRRILGGLHLNRFYLDALSWPDVNDEQIAELAQNSATIAMSNSRFRDAGGHDLVLSSGLKAVPVAVDKASARIELILAQGYSLGARHLERILDPSTKDRRGFWRYFASEPLGLRTRAHILEAIGCPDENPTTSGSNLLLFPEDVGVPNYKM